MTDQTKHTLKLKDVRVLVLGGTSGIGYGVVEALIENGAIVTISSSNQTRVESAISQLKTSYPSASSRISGHACDLADPVSVESNIKNLLAKVGELDHIVFTATDALPVMPLNDMTMESIQKAGVIRFNVPILLAKHAANYLKKSPSSSITFTGGVAAERPIPSWTLVTGYTTGLQGLTRGLALDLKPTRVNIVQPGMMDTNLLSKTGVPEEMKQGIFESERQRLPVGQIGRVEDVAEAYLYCMRDHNITAEIINTNGGALIV